jgi:hypothetical protein
MARTRGIGPATDGAALAPRQTARQTAASTLLLTPLADTPLSTGIAFDNRARKVKGLAENTAAGLGTLDLQRCPGLGTAFPSVTIGL